MHEINRSLQSGIDEILIRLWDHQVVNGRTTELCIQSKRFVLVILVIDSQIVVHVLTEERCDRCEQSGHSHEYLKCCCEGL